MIAIERAQVAVKGFLQYGTDQQEIAARAEVSPSLVSRVNSWRNGDLYSVSEKVASRIEHEYRVFLEERNESEVRLIPFRSMHTCDSRGIDAQERREIETTIHRTLSAKCLGKDYSPKLPNNIPGASTWVGEDLLVILFDRRCPLTQREAVARHEVRDQFRGTPQKKARGGGNLPPSEY